jgi:DNA polymerase III subunit beta
VKFRCERDVLVEALGTAGRAAARSGAAMQVLSGVRMEVTGDRLQLAGSDLDLTIQTSVAVNGARDGVAVVYARLAADIVRNLEPGAVSVEADDEAVRISSGRSQFAVRPFAAMEFPRLPQRSGDAVTLDVAGFADALKQVVRAASGDDARPLLTGVLLAAEESGLRLVATDSYRLAVRDLPGQSVLRAGQEVLVPSRALNELARVLPAEGQVTLRLGEQDATFEIGDVQLTTRLIEGQFPNYRQLIPSNYPNRLVVGREPLLDAVRRVKLLANSMSASLHMSLRPDGITLSVADAEFGTATEDLDAKYEGAEITVAFNPTYLTDGVDAVPGDEVVLETIDALKPATLRGVDAPEFLYLLMPVRV